MAIAKCLITSFSQSTSGRLLPQRFAFTSIKNDQKFKFNERRENVVAEIGLLGYLLGYKNSKYNLHVLYEVSIELHLVLKGIFYPNHEIL